MLAVSTAVTPSESRKVRQVFQVRHKDTSYPVRIVQSQE